LSFYTHYNFNFISFVGIGILAHSVGCFNESNFY
jgi:hypothetical protein